MFRLSTFLFIWYLITYVFLPVPPARGGVDESWRAFLTWAFEHGRQFGTDVVFTYGPWGFLLEPRGGAGIYGWQILGRMVLALGASAGIALTGVCWIRSTRMRWLWAAALAVLAEPAALTPFLLFAVTMPKGIEFRWKTAVLLPVACAAGLAACTKFTCLLMVLAMLPVLAMRKRLAIPLAATVASFLIFWMLAGQDAGNLVAFVQQGWEVARGYSTAMVSGRVWTAFPLALLICGLPVLQFASRIKFPPALEEFVRFGWLGLCELMIFRHGVTRSDPEHAYLAFLTLGIPVALLVIALPERPGPRWPESWSVTYGVLLLAALAGVLSTSWDVVQVKAKIFTDSFGAYPRFLGELGSARDPEPSAAGDAGTVDVFPDELAYAIMNRLPLRNRPVIQSYTAYTPALCRENAAFLEGSAAPGTIYFHSDLVDWRYPALQDSLAWRSLLTHYVPTAVQNGFLVLKRREHPAVYRLQPVAERKIRVDEPLDIPEVPEGLVWAEVKVERTLTGRLLDLFLRNEKMWLRVETARRSRDFLMLDETAAGGFLLSPVVLNQASMLDLYQPESRRYSAERVRRLVLHRLAGGRVGFGPDIEVKLYALTIEGYPAEIPGGLTVDLGRTVRAERALSSVEFSPSLALQENEVRLMVGAPSTAWIPFSGGKSLHVRYGTDAQRPACGGLMTFQILAGRGGASDRQPLWQDVRESQPGKGWEAESTIPLPTARGDERLYFETGAGERSCGAEGTYWADVRIEQ